MNFKNQFNLFLFLLINLSGFSQNTYIPDDGFEQALIDLGYDSGTLDDFVPTVNIAGITNLLIQNKGIEDLTGIENFSALVLFNCTDNLIESLDLSNNTNLQIINADRNRITSVDVTKNVLLESFYIGENLLTGIDISQNTILKYFFCSVNQITNLNIVNNTELINLSCFMNNMTSFTIPINNALEELEISDNFLTSLNVSNGQSIRNISCVGNQLSNLDVSACLNLDVFLISDNDISTIALSTNTSLFGLWCENNPLTDLDLSQNLDIHILRFGGTLLTDLDLSFNSKLYRVVGNNNQYMCAIDLRNGSNSLISDFSILNSPQLTCVFVDDPVYSDLNWTQIDPNATFVSNQTECENLPCNIQVDSINDITTSESFVLPNLINGKYFTGPNGGGFSLNPGDIIFTSQKIYIYNESTCIPGCNEGSSFNVIINSSIISDVFIPKYFTPNNDGIHDVWKVVDKNNAIKNISIFNRFGKLLKSLSNTSNGWNGTYNGKPLESNDYWYLISLNSGASLKGHFSLKR